MKSNKPKTRDELLQEISLLKQKLAKTENLQQVLHAANQQLQATEQQLRAANQQLKAAEEQAQVAKEKFKKAALLRNAILESPRKIIVFALDKQYRYLDFTSSHKKVMKEIWGVDIKPGNNMLDFIKNDTDRLKAKCNFDRALKGEHFILQEEYGDENLKRTFYEDHYSPVYDENKMEIIGLSVYVVDITERKKAEQALKESENRFKALSEATYEAIVITDNGVCIEANLAASKMFGYQYQELIGMFGTDLIAPESKETVKQNMLSGYEELYYAVARRKDGTTFPTEIQGRMFEYKGRKVRIAAVRDITERKKAEEQIKKLSTAVIQSPAAIAITNLQGQLEYVNPKFEELTGYSLREALGKNPRILKSGEHPTKMYRKLWKTITSGQTWHGEFHNKKKNNELYWESASISPIFDKNGEITNYIKLAEEITEQKRKEQIQKVIHSISNAVLTSVDLHDFAGIIQKELNTVIDTTNFYIALYDEKTNRFTFVFQQDEKDDFSTLPVEKTLTVYVFRTQQPLLATEAVTEELEKSGEIELFGAPSKSWLGIPLLIDKKAIGVFALQSYTDKNAFRESDIQMLEIISHQISLTINRKKQEEDLKAALEKAKESDRLKSAFLANMSHEIRTPMNGIIGFVNLLSNTGLSNLERKKYEAAITQSSERLLNTINDLIDISKIEAGQMKVSKTETSINKLFDELYNFFKPEAVSKGLALYSLPTLSDKEAVIFTDENKLHGILTNLIKNAMKFTKTGSISFGYLLKGKSIQFYVKDTGIGIPEKRQKAIFNRFEQVDTSYTRPYEGSGLGLAIVKAYVEMLGGKIWLHSEENKGSTFNFTLPYDTKIPKKTDKTFRKTDTSHQKLNTQNMTLLIVEDDETSYYFLETILKNQFRKIYYARSGKEAIEITKNHPDLNLILMDIKIPEMDGYEATRRIRKFNKKVIIIAQTAFALAGDKEKALEAGCDGYISKPIKKEKLIRMIEKLLTE